MEAKMRSTFRKVEPNDSFSVLLKTHKKFISQQDEYVNLKSELRKLGIGVDRAAINFAFTESGDMTYLDKISPALMNRERSIRRLRKKIDTIEDQSVRNQTHRFLDRYEALTSNPRSSIHALTQRLLRT